MKPSRLLAVTWVGVVLAAMLLLNEPLRGMFDDTVRFESAGYAVFGLLLLASVAGVFIVLRSRAADPEFRGAISELTRLLSLGEALFIASAWIAYLLSAS